VAANVHFNYLGWQVAEILGHVASSGPKWTNANNTITCHFLQR
jgi:hypothetical protein